MIVRRQSVEHWSASPAVFRSRRSTSSSAHASGPGDPKPWWPDEEGGVIESDRTRKRSTRESRDGMAREFRDGRQSNSEQRRKARDQAVCGLAEPERRGRTTDQNVAPTRAPSPASSPGAGSRRSRSASGFEK